MNLMNNMHTSLFRRTGQIGFTLVELMITMVIASLISAALYSAYISQQRSQTAQDQIVEMQQHLRGGVNFMVRELRMAGCDPQLTADAGIVAATSTTVTFTLDVNDNGAEKSPGDGDVADPEESITYGFTAGADANNDGVVDANFTPFAGATAGTASIDRTTNDPVNPGPFPIADNIEALELLYLVGDDFTPTLAPAAAEFDNIRAIVISILARVRNPDQKFTNNQVYLPASNDSNIQKGVYNINSGVSWAVNDNYRRRLMITTVNLRNMGL
ncbi:prepilin-type N-terminal cleavage/methylation domain-containing protein [Desulfogranum japonicum]|uniref:prepilin-type N-terminal cleavage/methylation domain-containing protein n=1 Tax=Desulfogranum japonicum TaxID=231447 RepID=UPI0004051027|nr:prepilin-type N-terminal cleavage/methylation domain-containing protein [Desulfogranum japonicum]